MQKRWYDQGLGLTGNIAGAGVAGMGKAIEQMTGCKSRLRRQADGSSRRKAEADRREAYDDLQRGYMAAQPGIPTGLSGARSEMSRRTPPPMYMSEGGQDISGRSGRKPLRKAVRGSWSG